MEENPQREASLEQLFQSSKCVQCKKRSEKVFLAPYCPHVLCIDCFAHSAPQRCPTCQTEFLPELMTPDLVFEFLRIESRSFQKSVRVSVSDEPALSPNCLTSKFLKRNAKGETGLHQYCSLAFKKNKGFKMEKLKDMLANGANPNTYDAGGITPLHEAVLYDNVAIVSALLEAGARVNCYRVPPYTPLHTAVDRYRTAELTEGSVARQMITTLLSYGANVRAKDRFRKTPIDIAQSNPELLALLSSYKSIKTDRMELLAPEQPMVVMPCFSDKTTLAALKTFTQHFKIKSQPVKSGLSADVTHVILSRKPDKSSFLIRKAILSGCYIVTMEWVRNSLAKDRVLPAEDYEISGPLSRNSKLDFPSRRARMARMCMKPKLFAGGQFHVLSNSSQEMEKEERIELIQLIETGGGSILSREPKHANTGEGEPTLFHAPEGSMFEGCAVFVLFKNFPNNFPTVTFNMPHMKHVPVQWFYDCVDTYSIREW